jgi:uncharacterized protein YbjQ (UPF0145 family)
MAHELIVTTGDAVAGHAIAAHLGVVRGIAVRAATLGQGFQALGNVLSGNVQASWEMYEQVCEAARESAYQRMVRQAQERGAHAIIAMRYDATDLGQGATEVLAYGTAVKLEVLDVALASATPVG